MTSAESFTLPAPDGVDLLVRRWSPATSPVGVVLIAHGAAEHSGRYDRLARALTEARWEVWASDHRAHGGTARTLGVAEGGWEGILADQERLIDRIRTTVGDAPLVYLGHSMGSLIARIVASRRGRDLAGLVLSGPFEGSDDLGAMVDLLVEAVEQHGADAPSELFAAQFAAFNAAFEPTRTPFDWLSRDTAEVDAYVADPWCGFGLSNGFVADMMRQAVAQWQRERTAGLPTGLPVLILAGDRDPVGGFGEGVRSMADRFRSMGLDVTVHLYPDARHEVFNETNRDEVTADLLAWLGGVARGATPHP